VAKYENLTVIIPTLNEAGPIAKLVPEILKAYAGCSIIICDDGSLDGTQKVARSFGKKVKLIDRADARVHGLCASVLEGIDGCGTEFFVVMDGDLQHPPQTVGQLHKSLVLGADAAIASRQNVLDSWPLHRRLISAGAETLGKIRLGSAGYGNVDILSGFFGMRTKEAARLHAQNPDRFALEGYKVLFDFLKLMPWPKVESVPYDFGKRHSGKSKLGARHMLLFIRSLLT